MGKKKIFNLSGISIIACECLQAIICIFVDLFFVSKILTHEGSVAHNIIQIGLFYVILYSIMTLSYTFIGFALKKVNKSMFISLGAIVLTVVVLMIRLFGDSLYSFVPLIAFVYGIGYSMFSNGFNNLMGLFVSSKHQVKFFAVKKILYQLTYVIFPVTLGIIVDIDFSLMALIMVGVGLLMIMFSIFIRPKEKYNLSFNLPKFARHLKENKQETKPLFLVYVSNFFRGASYDSFTTLISILVILTFNSNTDLGMFQSIFTACSLITMFMYLRFYRKKRAKVFILPTIILVSLTVIAILITTNKVTILCFYAIYVTLNVILMSISDSRRSSVVRLLSLHTHILESNAFAEFFLGAGRVTSSLFVLLAGVFDGLMGGGSLFLKIALGLVCLMYVGYGISLLLVEKLLIKQDCCFKQVHINEVIEKTED